VLGIQLGHVNADYPAPAAVSRWRPTPGRLVQLLVGLWLFGTGEGLIVLAGLGNSPWTVLAQGVSLQTPLSIGGATIVTSIVVDAHGATLYRLKPETTRHLLCKSSTCLAIWKPLTVRSSSTSKIKAGPGVTGSLGLLRRARNSYQVTLRGLPLYTFAGDSRRGDDNGEKIHSFGGTWFSVPASTRSASPAPTAPSPTTTAPTYPPY